MNNLRQDKTQASQDGQLDHAIRVAIDHYGVSADSDMVEHLLTLYRQYADQTEPEKRLATYQATVKKLTEGCAGVHVLLPFLVCDSDRTIASTAALDYAVLAPWVNNPTEGAQVLIDMYRQGAFENGPAVLGGLLMTGDQRILNLLSPACRTLVCRDVEIMIHCRSGFLTKAMVEFYLVWLEALDSKDDCDLYGAVAAGLANLAMSSTDQTVYDIEREIPSTPDNPIRLIAQWPLSEYAASIKGRLERIALKEQGQPIMPVVMSVWGLS